MLVISLLLLVGSFLVAECSCPSKCECTENAVNCMSVDLESVPYLERLTNNPVIVDLSGNSISEITIDDFSFEKCDEVKEIYLNRSEVITIDEQALVHLTSLQELYLADNYLSTLPLDLITKNENMILLDVSSNYFESMPKIKSESLEVLAVADSGISEIPRDSLEHLPNLRTLLIQQNNLKQIDPVVFKRIPHFFFVRMAFNAWKCNCKTVKLFNYLTANNLVDITEPVQCLTHNKTFVDIYDDRGIAENFTKICDEDKVELRPQLKMENREKKFAQQNLTDQSGIRGINNNLHENKLVPSPKMRIENLEKNVTPEDQQVENQKINNLMETDMNQYRPETLVTKTNNITVSHETANNEIIYSTVLVVSIVVSLILGVTFGSLATRYFLHKIQPTSSTKHLLQYDEA